MKRNSHLLLFFAFLPIVLLAQSRSDTLTQKLETLYESNTIPGYGLAIVNQSDVLYENAFGYADVAAQKAYTTQTVHNIGSVSKTFIAAAVMQLIEQGKLSLDTKINDILPFTVVHPKYPKVPITMHHLVTHTAGIKDTKVYNTKCYVLLDDYDAVKKDVKGIMRWYMKQMSKNKQQSLPDFLKDFLHSDGKLYKQKNFDKYQPGTHYHYSNISSALAAYVVEIVAKQPYGEYVKEHIMQPLQMNNSGWSYEDIADGLHAQTYTHRDEKVPQYELITYPDGGVRTNVEDLSRYLKAMINAENELLSPKSYKTMFEEQFTSAEDRVGVFWDYDRRGNITHNGADPGIFTMILFDPKEKVGFVFMTNCSVHEDKKMFGETIEIVRLLRKYSLRMQADIFK